MTRQISSQDSRPQEQAATYMNTCIAEHSYMLIIKHNTTKQTINKN